MECCFTNKCMEINLISLLCCCNSHQHPKSQQTVDKKCYFPPPAAALPAWFAPPERRRAVWNECRDLAEQYVGRGRWQTGAWTRAVMQQGFCAGSVMSVPCCCLSIQTTLSAAGGPRHNPAGNTAKQIHCHGDCITVSVGEHQFNVLS